MDRKTLLILFYCTAVLPISYTLGQRFLPSWSWLGFGLINTIALIFLSVFFVSYPINPSSKKKKMILFILALFVSGILFSGIIDGLLVKGSFWFHQMMSSSRVNTTTTGVVSSLSQENESLTIVIPTMTSTVSQTGSTTITGTVKPVILESDEDPIETKPTPTTSTVSVGDGSYAKVIPYLVTTYKLTDKDKTNPVFQSVSATSSLYTSFATAYANTMIGKNINPTTKVSCDTYLVLKGIAAGWKVSYTGSPFAAYRAEAAKRGVVNGCYSKEYVTTKTL